MRVLCVTAILLFAFVNNAFAAEQIWSGYRLGILANVSSTDEDEFHDASSSDPSYLAPEDFCYSNAGSGAKGGYQHQFPSGLVIGVEVSYETLGITDGNNKLLSNQSVFVGDLLPIGVSVDRIYAVRPKVGYAFSNLLFHLGPELVHTELSLKSLYRDPFLPITADVKASTTDVAWTAGLDWRMSKNWSAGLQYRKAGSISADFDIDQNSYAALYLSRPISEVTRHKYGEINFEQLSFQISYHF